MEKGSLTAEGITIDGQLGNTMQYNSMNHLTGLPHVSVSLKNCTVMNSLVYSAYNTNTSCINFEDYAKGLDLTVDGCTINNSFQVSSCTGENITITNSTLYNYMQSASTDGTTVFTGNIVSSDVHINTGKLTIKDDTIGSGLGIKVTNDTVLENLNVTAKSRNGAAVSTSGVGTVTVKSGVYNNTGKKGYVFEAEGSPIVIEGGYFKSLGTVASDSKYRTPANKKLGEVTEGDYAGYYTIVDDTEGTVADPVATIYNAETTAVSSLSLSASTSVSSVATSAISSSWKSSPTSTWLSSSSTVVSSCWLSTATSLVKSAPYAGVIDVVARRAAIVQDDRRNHKFFLLISFLL